jgi:hypothetical protein
MRPVPDHTDVETVDPSVLRQEAERVTTVAQAEALARIEAGEAEAAQLTQRAEQLEAEQLERARQLAYLVAVEQERAGLATAIDAWKRAGDELEAATGQRDAARGKLSEARERGRSARENLDALTATDAPLDELEAARLAVATTESLPGLVGPAVERAEAGVRDATEARKWATVDVQRSWDALGRLGKEAREGIERPACVPDPEEQMWKDFEARMELSILGRQQRAAENKARARRGLAPR